MNWLPYYKAYPRDFIEGTVGMSFELKGAYRLVLDLIYMQGGNLPDDERYISGLLGCTIRKWKSFRAELVARGKIQVNGEFLTNERAVSELETLRKLTDKQSENRSKPNKNKEIKSPSLNHTEPEPDTEATLSSVAEAPPQNDLDILQSKLIEAAGENGIQPHGAIVVGPIVELIATGVNLELDILPVIRARCNGRRRPAGSWAYFVPAIREAYERRVGSSKGIPAKPLPTNQSDEWWSKKLSFARLNRIWETSSFGPMPGKAGCMVPPHLLQSDDGKGWRDTDDERKRAAA